MMFSWIHVILKYKLQDYNATQVGFQKNCSVENSRKEK